MHDAHDKEKVVENQHYVFVQFRFGFLAGKFLFQMCKTREENEQCGANFDLEINCRKVNF